MKNLIIFNNKWYPETEEPKVMCILYNCSIPVEMVHYQTRKIISRSREFPSTTDRAERVQVIKQQKVICD